MSEQSARKFRACCIGAALGESLGMPAEGMTREEIADTFGVVDRQVDRPSGNDFQSLPAGFTAKQTEALLALLRASEPLPDLQNFAFNIKDAFSRHPEKWPNSTTFPWPPFPDGGHYSLAFAIPAAWQMAAHQSDVERLSGWLQTLEPVSVVWQQGVWIYLRMLNLLFGSRAGQFDRSQLLKSIIEFIDEAERLFPQDFKIRRRFQLIEPLLDGPVDELVQSCGGVSTDAANILAFTGALFYRNHDDFRKALTEAANAGGSSDAIGFYLGSLLGALHGPEILPDDWLAGLKEKDRILSEVDRYQKTVSV